MLRPCPNVVSCPGSDDPVSNTSSEAPDGLDYLSSFFFGGSGIPPLFHNWSAVACDKTFVSNISELDALLQALSQAIQCLDLSWNQQGGNIWPSGSRGIFNHSEACTRFCQDGSPFTYSIPSGVIPGINRATADALALAWACKLASEEKICLNALPRGGCIGTAYAGQVIVSGNNPGPFTLFLFGTLPPGLTFSGAGLISGTPTTAGSFNFSVEAVSADGNAQIRNYTITVLDMTPHTLATATVGQPYSQQLSVTGGTAPYSFAVSFGLLPAGITLSSSGLLSGTPTTAGTDIFSITVTDSNRVTCDQIFTVVTNPAVVGWTICQWTDVVLPGLIAGGAIPAWPTPSAKPAWNGVFDQKHSTLGNVPPPTDNFWYFLSQSIDGKATAPDETVEWPFADADWSAVNYTQLNWLPGPGIWRLYFAGADDGDPGRHVIYGQNVPPADPNDASGTYTLSHGSSVNPPTIQIVKSTETSKCCGTGTDWRNSPGNCALRILNYTDGDFGLCVACGANFGAAWDGTFDTFANFGNPDFAQFTYTGAATSVSGFAIGQGPKLFYSLGQNRWIMQIYCQSGGGPITLWEGKGPIGTSPLGTYNDDGNGCALGKPASYVVQAYSK